MRLLKHIQRALLAAIVICLVYAQQVNGQNQAELPQNDEQILMNYLSLEHGNSELTLLVHDLIYRGQVFFLIYERDEPVKDEQDLKKQLEFIDYLNTNKGVTAHGSENFRANKTYPGLNATFSKLFTSDKPDLQLWLKLMKLPFDSGYKLKSVRIVYQPSMEIKKQSFEKSKKIMAQIVSEIKKNKSEFKQLAEYDKVTVSEGKWENGDWPTHYPNLFYQYGYGKEIPDTKGAYEKTTENWCSIQIGFEPVRGFGQAQIRSGKTFSRQGIEASWIVESESQEFNKAVSDIVIKSLADLDEYEKELEKSQSVSSLAAKIKENSEKLTASDKELTRKWDLPEDVIAQTPTDKLFLHFINSPLVAMLMIYDSPEPGVKRLLNSSTTLHEFYTRDDIAEGALKMYVEYDLSPESINDETLKEVFSRDPRIRDNPEIQERLAPDNIINMKIAHVTMQIMHADLTLLTPQFFLKLKGHEKET